MRAATTTKFEVPTAFPASGSRSARSASAEFGQYGGGRCTAPVPFSTISDRPRPAASRLPRHGVLNSRERGQTTWKSLPVSKTWLLTDTQRADATLCRAMRCCQPSHALPGQRRLDHQHIVVDGQRRRDCGRYSKPALSDHFLQSQATRAGSSRWMRLQSCKCGDGRRHAMAFDAAGWPPR